MVNIIEGGAFYCGIHDFGTEDPEEFEQHRVRETHYEEGQAPCMGKHKIVTFTKEDKIRYQGVGKDLFVLCEICMETMNQ
jgi:hypothetical protein